jgi:hypothetical protein
MKYLWMVIIALLITSIWNGIAIDRRLKNIDARLENIEYAKDQ